MMIAFADTWSSSCSLCPILSLVFTGLAYLESKRLSTLWLDGCTVSVDAALALSDSRCPNISYISLRNLLPVPHDDEDEVLLDEVFALD